MSGSQKPGRKAPRPDGATADNSLYERYKDALRRGHVAALRGRPEAAIDAYGEAAAIAPDRALPHTSMGGTFVNMNRLADARRAYDRALALAPRDEGALRGLAELHIRAGRRTEAAAVLDRLADSLDAGGRLADATDVARHSLELAESRPRRRQVEGLVGRLRATSGEDDAVRRALDQALRLLEPPSEPSSESIAGATTAETALAADTPTDAPERIGGAVDQGHVGEPIGFENPAPPAEPGGRSVSVETDEQADPDEPETGGSAEPGLAEPEPVEPIGLGIALGAVAEAALHAGDLVAAHDGLLAAARAHRRAGRLSAALDACYLAIGLAPSDPDLHLLLVELYLDRGWRGQAIDKMLLLGRLADLDDDTAVGERLCAVVRERLPDEPRVAELCA